jgi:hypothetical protein
VKPKIRMGDVRDSERLAHVLRAELRRGDAAECGMLEERRCGIGSWGGRCPSLADYVTGTGPTDGTTAAGGC